MPKDRDLRPDSPESKSDASPSGPGIQRRPSIPPDQDENALEPGAPRNTPPDNEFDDVKTSSNE